MYCSNCGAEIKEGSKFCKKCGSQIYQTVNALDIKNNDDVNVLKNEFFETDSDNNILFDNNKNEENIDKSKETTTQNNTTALYIILKIISYVCLVFSILLIIIDIHSDSLLNIIDVSNISLFSKKLVIKIPYYSNFAYEYLNYTGLLGLEVLVLYGFLSGISYKEVNKITQIMKIVSLILILIMLLYHFYKQYIQVQ